MEMSGFRIPEASRYAGILFSRSMDESIPKNHPVRLVDEIFRSKQFRSTFEEMEGTYHLADGRPPYRPIYIAALYIYGMMNRLRSSRQLEQACNNRTDVMWLMDGQAPDHSSIAAFVEKHSKSLKPLFRATIHVAVKADLVKLGHIAVDGTKVEADASNASVVQRSTIEKELAEIAQKTEALEKEWAANERCEGNLLGEETPWIAQRTKDQEGENRKFENRRKMLNAALETIDRRQDEGSQDRKPLAIASTTDPDARQMKDKKGQLKPGYNTQIAVDANTGIIVAESTSDAANDMGQLPGLVAQAAENIGEAPNVVVADSGYNVGADLATLEAQNIATYLPDAGQSKPMSEARAEAIEVLRSGVPLTDAQLSLLAEGKKKLFGRLAFIYQPDTDTYRCPKGATLHRRRTSKDKQVGGVSYRTQYTAKKEDCANCPLAARCLSKPGRPRMITRDQYEDNRDRLRERMKTPEGRAIYKRRGPAVETRFAEQKHILGIRRFMRRGIAKVSQEWTMICTALNFRALLRQWAVVGAMVRAP